MTKSHESNNRPADAAEETIINTQEPTPLPELNQVLVELVETIQRELSDNFVGAAASHSNEWMQTNRNTTLRYFSSQHVSVPKDKIPYQSMLEERQGCHVARYQPLDGPWIPIQPHSKV